MRALFIYAEFLRTPNIVWGRKSAHSVINNIFYRSTFNIQWTFFIVPLVLLVCLSLFSQLLQLFQYLFSFFFSKIKLWHICNIYVVFIDAINKLSASLYLLTVPAFKTLNCNFTVAESRCSRYICIDRSIFQTIYVYWWMMTQFITERINKFCTGRGHIESEWCLYR